MEHNFRAGCWETTVSLKDYSIKKGQTSCHFKHWKLHSDCWLYFQIAAENSAGLDVRLMIYVVKTQVNEAVPAATCRTDHVHMQTIFIGLHGTDLHLKPQKCSAELTESSQSDRFLAKPFSLSHKGRKNFYSHLKNSCCCNFLQNLFPFFPLVNLLEPVLLSWTWSSTVQIPQNSLSETLS